MGTVNGLLKHLLNQSVIVLMNSLLFWYVWMWQVLRFSCRSNNGWVKIWKQSWLMLLIYKKCIMKAVQGVTEKSVATRRRWDKFGKQTGMSHNFSREIMILGAGAFQILTVWVCLCQASRHGAPIFQHARKSNSLLPFPSAKLQMANLSLCLGWFLSIAST